MDKLVKIQLRRQVLDWRDQHVENIQHHFNREIVFLFHELDQRLENISNFEIFNIDDYAKKHLEPFYAYWIKNEVTALMEASQSDLSKIYQHSFDYQGNNNRLSHLDDAGPMNDVSTAALSTGAAVLAIPAVLSLSTTTVSVGGVLGFLGVTTTVISWPIALTGGAVVLGLSAFGGKKMINLKSQAVDRYKDRLHESIKEVVIGVTNGNSVCEQLQSKIEEVANALLAEVNF